MSLRGHQMKLKRENRSSPRHHQMFLIFAVLCIIDAVRACESTSGRERRELHRTRGENIDVNCKLTDGWNVLLTVCRFYNKDNIHMVI
jgi:hypothetical protein